MKQVPCYICEKCLYYELGEKNALRVQSHERMSARGVCNSLYGLIVRTGHEQSYMVFRQAPLLSTHHEALYQWNMYLRPSLKPKEFKLPKEITVSLQRIVPDRGLTADYILGAVLWRGGAEESHKNYTELFEGKFHKIFAKIKRTDPKIFSNTA